VPDDRLGDLGRGEGGAREERGEPGRTAAERLAELDEREPEQRSPAPGAASDEPPSRPGLGRYMWIVGIVFAALAIYAAFDATRHGTAQRDYLQGLSAGERLPDFAAPLATGRLDGDANVSQGGADSRSAGPRPACAVRSPEVVNVCELRKRPLVLTFIVTRGADCAPELSLVDRVSRDYPRLAFVGVVSGDSRKRVARLVGARRIAMPVAVDRDAAVVNLYRVGVCPTITLADRGGKVRATRLGKVSETALRRDLDGLAGWTR
jgi:hypothetical protein